MYFKLNIYFVLNLVILIPYMLLLRIFQTDLKASFKDYILNLIIRGRLSS